MMKIGNEGGDRYCGTCCRGSVARRCQINLFIRSGFPQLRIGLVDYAVIGDDPLAVKRTKPVASRGKTGASFLSNGLSPSLVPVQRIWNGAIDMFIARPSISKVRVKKSLFLMYRGIDQLLPTPL